MSSPKNLLDGVLQGNRRSLAKAITLIESDKLEDRVKAEELLKSVMTRSGSSIRIGISGPPGVGKSTFIEAFGKLIAEQGKSVAVLAIDPTSPVTGGSILGDKTRMEELVRFDKAFIRPSPSRGSLGGVSRRTREAILICEAAGFDFVLIETVGVGQSEITVSTMVDVFVILQLPNAGDELQGIKKGILEKADIIVITKADGEQKKFAERTKLEQQRALNLVRSNSEWIPPILTISALERHGLQDVQEAVIRCFQLRFDNGDLKKLRKIQARIWFEQELLEGTRDWLSQQFGLNETLSVLEKEVMELTKPASAAARELFAKISTRA